MSANNAIYLFLPVAISLATADAVMCLYVVSVWLFTMSVAAMDIGCNICILSPLHTFFGFSLTNLSGPVKREVVLNCKARNVASMSFLLLMVIAGLLERYSPNKGRS
jgi:hypothetical protein